MPKGQTSRKTYAAILNESGASKSLLKVVTDDQGDPSGISLIPPVAPTGKNPNWEAYGKAMQAFNNATVYLSANGLQCSEPATGVWRHFAGKGDPKPKGRGKATNDELIDGFAEDMKYLMMLQDSKVITNQQKATILRPNEGYNPTLGMIAGSIRRVTKDGSIALTFSPLWTECKRRKRNSKGNTSESAQTSKAA